MRRTNQSWRANSRKSNARSVPRSRRPVHSRPRGEVAAPVPAQPMQDRHHDEGEQRKRDEEVEQRRETGQGEQVKAQVGPKSGSVPPTDVPCAHVRKVIQSDDAVMPTTRATRSALKSSVRGGRAPRRMDATTTVDEECGKTSGPSPRPPDVAVENAERNDRARDEQGDTPAQRREEHRLELHLSEPEPVGGESGDPWKHQDDEEQRPSTTNPTRRGRPALWRMLGDLRRPIGVVIEPGVGW